MKDFQGSSEATVVASVEDCVALVSDLPGYARWYGSVVRSVNVLERDGEGRATSARTRVKVPNMPLGELAMTLVLADVEGGAVTLQREAHGPDDHERFRIRWVAASAPGGSRLELRLDASLSVPRLLPTSGLGDAMARGFIHAAASALGR